MTTLELLAVILALLAISLCLVGIIWKLEAICREFQDHRQEVRRVRYAAEEIRNELRIQSEVKK